MAQCNRKKCHDAADRLGRGDSTSWKTNTNKTKHTLARDSTKTPNGDVSPADFAFFPPWLLASLQFHKPQSQESPAF